MATPMAKAASGLQPKRVSSRKRVVNPMLRKVQAKA